MFGNTTTLTGVAKATSALQATGNLTQPFDMQQIMAFNTIQPGQDQATQPL